MFKEGTPIDKMVSAFDCLDYEINGDILTNAYLNNLKEVVIAFSKSSAYENCVVDGNIHFGIKNSNTAASREPIWPLDSMMGLLGFKSNSKKMIAVNCANLIEIDTIDFDDDLKSATRNIVLNILGQFNSKIDFSGKDASIYGNIYGKAIACGLIVACRTNDLDLYKSILSIPNIGNFNYGIRTVLYDGACKYELFQAGIDSFSQVALASGSFDIIKYQLDKNLIEKSDGIWDLDKFQSGSSIQDFDLMKNAILQIFGDDAFIREDYLAEVHKCINQSVPQLIPAFFDFLIEVNCVDSLSDIVYKINDHGCYHLLSQESKKKIPQLLMPAVEKQITECGASLSMDGDAVLYIPLAGKNGLIELKGYGTQGNEAFCFDAEKSYLHFIKDQGIDLSILQLHYEMNDDCPYDAILCQRKWHSVVEYFVELGANMDSIVQRAQEHLSEDRSDFFAQIRSRQARKVANEACADLRAAMKP